MDVSTAHSIVDQLGLTKAQKKELAVLLCGGVPKRKARAKVLTVEDAKKNFKQNLKNKFGCC